MRVTRLEIFGFKSFMDRLVLPLEGGVTGVVGPNGCGKSNIVDAIRWILGETRASSLRGGVLEDVIFNGTDKLRPLGLAEVSMVIRANGPNLLADMHLPMLEIDAILEEAMKEVPDQIEEPEQEERPKLTVIAGGLDGKNAGDERTEEQQSAAPSEAAAMAAKQFPWLHQANEVQITRRLYRSGDSEFFINRIPCRLKDIKDLFRAMGIAARGYTLVAQGEVARIVTSKPQERRYILEEAAGVHGFRDKIATAERRLADTEQNVARINDIIKEVERQVGVLKRQAERARNRQALKDQIQERDMALFRDSLVTFSRRRDDVDARSRKGKADAVRAENALQAASGLEMAARGELMQVDIESDTLRLKIDAIKEELHNKARQCADTRSRINELRAFQQGKKTEIQRLEERSATLLQRKEDCAREIEKLRKDEAATALRLQNTEGTSREDLQRLDAVLQELRNDLRKKESELRTVRDELISRQSSLDSIEQQMISASPLARLEETARPAGASGSDALQSKDFKMLVEGLVVPPGVSKALQAVLAERAAYLISGDPHALGARFSHRAREVDPENKKGLGLGAYRSGNREPNIPEGVPFQSLLRRIEVADSYRHAVFPLLEKCFIVETVDSAVKYFGNATDGGEAAPEGLTLVTLDGDIVTADSFFSFRHQGGLIHLKNRAVDFERRIAELSAMQSGLERVRDEIAANVAGAEQRHKEAVAEAGRRHAVVKELSAQLGSLRGKLQSEERLSRQIASDMEKTAGQIGEALSKITEYEQEEEIVTAQFDAIASTDDRDLRKELDELNAGCAEIDKRRKEGRSALESLSEEVRRSRRSVDDARAEASQVELAVQKLSLEHDALKEKVCNEYGEGVYQEVMSSFAGSAPLDGETREKYRADVQRLRERILREGDVDPESVDRYEAERERLVDLKAQRDDLEKAAVTLKKTVAKLTDTAEKRFVSVFSAVEKNFSRLIPQLFGGGKGSIELLDPSKPLDSGIEIIMRPPGKKPKSIDLLSGGEKALTAIALIVAMFLERPSPLCVLDEVDAPLDDANLLRFLSLVKEMSSRTQFIMITHNKQSMAVADHLVGVTMEEPGASKIISVSLQEAYSQVA